MLLYDKNQMSSILTGFGFYSQPYPSVFITAYENDQRIPLTGVLRYVQKLRKAALDYASRTSQKGKSKNIIVM